MTSSIASSSTDAHTSVRAPTSRALLKIALGLCIVATNAHSAIPANVQPASTSTTTSTSTSTTTNVINNVKSKTLAAPSSPRLILTTKGLVTDELRTQFRTMVAAARDCSDEKAPLTIAVVTTAMLAAKAQKELHADMQLRREAAAAHSRRLIADVTADQDVAASVLVVDPSHDTPEAMESALAASAAIFVLGGNTFYLWHHMRRTGLNELVRRRVDEGAVYVGLSAGSIVAGRTIATAFWKGWDDPEACVPHCDWSQPSAVAAMNLVGDRSFFPHFTQEWEALVQRRGDELGHDLVTLREEGAYVSGGETCAARTVEGREEAESEESEITMVSSLPL